MKGIMKGKIKKQIQLKLREKFLFKKTFQFNICYNFKNKL